MEENKFILCATDSDIQSALTAKRTSPYLVLDCEGQNLGTEGGTLALLSIGTASGRDVFLFEAVALARATPPMDELMALLGASDVTKIMWDCRMDAVALRQCGVSLAGVLDMQLAEVVSRAAALGDDEYRRLRRLRFVDEEAPGKAATRYVGVHAVTGMDKCLSLCKGGLEHVKSDTVKQMHRETGGSLWLQDPIPPELLAYAAHDIRAIATIYEHFLSVGWLPKSSRAALLAQSARYLDIHERPPASDNIFRRGPLLPLDILTEPALEKETCHGCVRQLSRGHFHVEPQDATRLAFCRVCEAAKLLAQKDEKRALGKTLTRPCELVEATAQT